MTNKIERSKTMNPVLFILFIIYFIITIIEINRDERRFEQEYGTIRNKTNINKTTIQYK